MRTFLFRIGNIGPFCTVRVNAETEEEGRKKALGYIPEGSCGRTAYDIRVQWWNTVSLEEVVLGFDPIGVTEDMLTLVEVDGIPQQ